MRRSIAVSMAFFCEAVIASPLPPTIAKPTPPLAIDYEVHRLASGDRYEITMRFRGDASGRSTLTIPTRWASATKAERGIEGLAVLTAGARLDDTTVAQVKRVVHRPSAMLTVRYVLKQIADGPPVATAQTQFLPVIQPTWFEWIGWTTWVIPMASNDRPVRVHLSFKDLPADWTFASSYGLDAASVDFDGRMDGFQSALFIGGDFRLRSRPARGGPVITAMRGDWSFGDNAFADRVAKIVDGERAFWSDDSQRFTLIALMPLVAQAGNRTSAGTGLTQSLISYATSNTPLDDLDFLWTHEYFHTWNNGRLGRFPEPQTRLYWFSEGFTDYYMNALQLRLGLRSLEQYAGAYDEALRFLAYSPVGHVPNSEVVAGFFSSGDTIGRVPYRRGMLLAAKWNAEIRTASGGRQSLDDAMRSLHDQHRRGVEMLDEDRIIAVMQSYGVSDAEGDIARRIERGETFSLEAGSLSSCIVIDEVMESPYRLGFDPVESTRHDRFAAVEPDGPAYAAGLRDGQILRSLSYMDRADRLVRIEVREMPGGPIRPISYYPAGVPMPRPHAALAPGLDAREIARCTADLGRPPGR